jgi:Phosphotransferase enzyme family
MKVWSYLRHRPDQRTVPPELEHPFANMADLHGYELVRHEQLQTHVFRLAVRDAGRVRSLIFKRLEPERAMRNRLVLERWLPAVRLEAMGPTLLGASAEPDGRFVWHVYADLGNDSLAVENPDPAHVATAVEAIARLHLAFAGHGLLGECRLWGGDLGIHFFASSVRDAIYALESLTSPGVPLTQNLRDLRDHLLDRLHRLLEEELDRAREIQEWGGPETLLHGDLWRNNIFNELTPSGPRARLIDWDHAAVGPVSYDLSTFLSRFGPEQRLWILERYEECIAPAGWKLPRPEHLNRLFDTGERARIVNRLIWPAIAVRRGQHVDWGVKKLAEVAGWLEGVRPVLPVPASGGRRIPGGGGR